jgi:hypothetical protein
MNDQATKNLLNAAVRTIVSGNRFRSVRPVTLQFFIRDQRASAFVIANTEGTEIRWQLHPGEHDKPNLAVYLTTADLVDLGTLHCLRNYVAVHGDEQLVSWFKTQFMSISAEGKAAIESMSATAELTSVDRVSVESTSGAGFLKRYAVGNLPVLIADAMPNSRAANWTFDKMRSVFRDANVQVRTGDYAANIYQTTMATRTLKCGDYLAAFAAETSSETAQPPEYAASNVVPLEWSAWLDYPPFVPRALCAFAKFWIGPAGTLTPLHRDWADNFLTQLYGAKELALVSPYHARLLSPRVIHPFLDSCNWINPYNQRDPTVSECHPIFITLNAGEMLFLPAGWFHHVRATSFSLSVNFFMQRVPYAVCPPPDLDSSRAVSAGTARP